jgi:hypothetical protein
MSDIAGAVWNFVNYLVSGQWLSPAVDWVENAINYFFSGLQYWVSVIWKMIYNSFVGLYNWVVGGLECVYNSIRPYLANIITLWMTYYGIRKIIGSESMSVKNRVIGLFATPLLSWLAGNILSSFLPVAISLPRLSPLPENIYVDEVVKHQPLVVDYTSLYYRTAEDLIQSQIVEEYVSIRQKVVEAFEDLLHSQVVDETVVLVSTIVVSEDCLHDQVVEETVVIQ